MLEVNANNVTVDLHYATVVVPREQQPVSNGQVVAVSVRSERMALVDDSMPAHAGGGEEWQRIAGTFVKETYFGLTSTSLVRLPDGSEAAVRRLTGDASSNLHPGQTVPLAWRTGDARLHCD